MDSSIGTSILPRIPAGLRLKGATLGRHLSRVIAVSVFVLLGVGCAKSPYVPVEGVVLHEGKPAAGYAVLFHPADDRGKPATGRTDSDGCFYLTTIQDRDGALPDEYKVLIIPPNYRGPGASKGSGPDYTLADKTPLTCKVPPEGKVRFELTGKLDDKVTPSLLDQRPPPKK